MLFRSWRVGERRYVKYVEAQSGVTVNPREVYEYGLREIDRINKEMWVVARKIAPKAKSLTDVAAALNKNPKYVVNGRDELEKFLTGVTQSAIEELNDKYFVISPRIKRCDTKLDDDTIDESPYYWGPSDDLKRPGFAVYPTLKKDKFTIWRTCRPGTTSQFPVTTCRSQPRRCKRTSSRRISVVRRGTPDTEKVGLYIQRSLWTSWGTLKILATRWAT